MHERSVMFCYVMCILEGDNGHVAHPVTWIIHSRGSPKFHNMNLCGSIHVFVHYFPPKYSSKLDNLEPITCPLALALWAPTLSGTRIFLEQPLPSGVEADAQNTWFVMLWSHAPISAQSGSLATFSSFFRIPTAKKTNMYCIMKQDCQLGCLHCCLHSMFICFEIKTNLSPHAKHRSNVWCPSCFP